MDGLEMRVRRLDAAGVLPRKAHASDAGIDLAAPTGGSLAPSVVERIPLGIAVEIPDGYCLVFKDRSGLAARGVHVLGGVIDAGYRGELSVVLSNLGSRPFQWDAGDRIAQALIVPVHHVEIVEVGDLSRSARGDGGFGSTGR